MFGIDHLLIVFEIANSRESVDLNDQLVRNFPSPVPTESNFKCQYPPIHTWLQVHMSHFQLESIQVRTPHQYPPFLWNLKIILSPPSNLYTRPPQKDAQRWYKERGFCRFVARIFSSPALHGAYWKQLFPQQTNGLYCLVRVARISGLLARFTQSQTNVGCVDL